MNAKPTQAERLRQLLDDGQWHDTLEIRSVVYGDASLSLARVAARVWDVKQALPPGWRIDSERAPERKSIQRYRLVHEPPKPPVQRVLFDGTAGVAGWLVMLAPLWWLV